MSYESVADRIDDELEPLGFFLVYSAYGENDDDPGSNLHAVAFAGKAIIVADGDEYWGGSDSKGYESELLIDPTWLDIFKKAEESLAFTLDQHHCFFEGFKVVGGYGDVTLLELCMGS